MLEDSSMIVRQCCVVLVSFGDSSGRPQLFLYCNRTITAPTAGRVWIPRGPVRHSTRVASSRNCRTVMEMASRPAKLRFARLPAACAHSRR